MVDARFPEPPVVGPQCQDCPMVVLPLSGGCDSKVVCSHCCPSSQHAGSMGGPQLQKVIYSMFLWHSPGPRHGPWLQMALSTALTHLPLQHILMDHLHLSVVQCLLPMRVNLIIVLPSCGYAALQLSACCHLSRELVYPPQRVKIFEQGKGHGHCPSCHWPSC